MVNGTGSAQRADKILAQLFPEHSRSKIKDLIENRKIQFRTAEGTWKTLSKAGQFFEEDWAAPEMWRLDDEEWTRFVSRGGLKLQGVLDHFHIEVQGKVFMDIGLSTGGFSDCLLQRGVRHVYGVDVGKEQLHQSLRDNPALLWRDKVNARDPLPTEDLAQLQQNLGASAAAIVDIAIFDGVVMDVSFISLEKLIPNVVNYLRPGGDLVALVKPQFELGAEALNNKGVLKAQLDPVVAVEKNVAMFQEHRLKIKGWVPSAIEGENGNKEFFIWAQRV